MAGFAVSTYGRFWVSTEVWIQRMPLIVVSMEPSFSDS